MTPDCLCLIPARRGSRRFPGKNIALLAGRPLIEWTLDSALGSEVFSEIVVTSDDSKIEEIVDRRPRVIFERRQEHLAGDTSTVADVVFEYLSKPSVRQRFQYVAVLLPTCPLRTEDHIREAFDLLIRTNPKGSLVSVAEYEFPPQFALNLVKNDLSIENPEVYANSTRSQTVEPKWHPNGAIFVADVELFLLRNTFFTNPLTGFRMSKLDSIDIDWPHQLKLAEAMLAEKE